jgi:hypothetical protein
MRVVVLHGGVDPADQLAQRHERAAPDRPLRDVPARALLLVEPGATARDPWASSRRR